eukprot:scaffold43670_cov34-Phaeocystis_antarctica.AAC.1
MRRRILSTKGNQTLFRKYEVRSASTPSSSPHLQTIIAAAARRENYQRPLTPVSEQASLTSSPAPPPVSPKLCHA